MAGNRIFAFYRFVLTFGYRRCFWPKNAWLGKTNSLPVLAQTSAIRCRWLFNQRSNRHHVSYKRTGSVRVQSCVPNQNALHVTGRYQHAQLLRLLQSARAKCWDSSSSKTNKTSSRYILNSMVRHNSLWATNYLFSPSLSLVSLVLLKKKLLAPCSDKQTFVFAEPKALQKAAYTILLVSPIAHVMLMGTRFLRLTKFSTACWRFY